MKQQDAKRDSEKLIIRWADNAPHIRMIHCACTDEAKAALLRDDESLNRSQLDARRSSTRFKSFIQVVTDTFNDFDFKVHSVARPILHSDFTEVLACDLEDCSGVVTENFIEFK